MARDPDHYAELATTEQWRKAMIKARKAKGWSQAELGAHVIKADGTRATQSNISLIEGEGKRTIGSSPLVKEICRVLKLSLPKHYATEDDKAWSEAGRVLKEVAPDLHQSTLDHIKATVEHLSKKDEPEK